jgi:hypothetical protein
MSSEQLKVLIDKFNTQLTITTESYPDSKINDDSVYEQNVDTLYGIINQIDALQEKTSSEINKNNELIQRSRETIATAQEMSIEQDDQYSTVKQKLDDIHSTYDKDKIILALKICIVAFIFIKGNDIYVRNSSLFIGFILIFTSLYGTFLYLYT